MKKKKMSKKGKKNFPKNRAPGYFKKPEYPENRESSETFFPDSFLKINSLQAH